MAVSRVAASNVAGSSGVHMRKELVFSQGRSDSTVFWSAAFGFAHSCSTLMAHFPRAPHAEAKCGISGGFSALAVIESRLFICPTFYDM